LKENAEAPLTAGKRKLEMNTHKPKKRLDSRALAVKTVRSIRESVRRNLNARGTINE